MTTNKILVPMDGSKIAEHSLAYVRKLAELGEADVLLLSVVDVDHVADAANAEEVGARENNVLQSYLHEIAGDFHKHFGLKVETKIVTGRPAESILATAEEFKPDLLLISTHGRSGLSRWRFGSVADKVIRGAVANTFVIGPQATERERWLEADVEPAFKSILVPLDGSKLAEEALPVAERFARAYGSSLHLVRSFDFPISGNGMETVYEPDLMQQIEQGTKEYIAAMAARMAGVGEVHSQAVMGSAALVLEEYIEKHDIHLVIMTSHGRGGLIRTALGSVTDRMLGSKAPVLVVRS